MTFPEFTALLLLCSAMSFTPGPNTTLSAAIAANLGLRRALMFCLAVPVGWTGLMLACGLGLGAVVLMSPSLRALIKWAGIAYLVWLAFRLWRAHAAAAVPPSGLATSTLHSPASPVAQRPLHVGFWEGVAMQFLNVKAWMLALTLTGGWVINAQGQPAPNPDQRLLQVCAVMMVFAFSSNATYALMGAALRQWLGVGHRLTLFNRAMAVVLVATAAWLGLAV
jgi:threonine/homoserine/homoserine lactone efflux protein